jgi:ribosomal protein L17
MTTKVSKTSIYQTIEHARELQEVAREIVVNAKAAAERARETVERSVAKRDEQRLIWSSE